MGRETQNIPEYFLFKTPAVEEQRFGLKRQYDINKVDMFMT